MNVNEVNTIDSDGQNADSRGDDEMTKGVSLIMPIVNLNDCISFELR